MTRIGFKPVLITGMLFIAAGLIWFGQVSVGGSYVGDVLFPSLLAAVGLGLLVRAGDDRGGVGRGASRRPASPAGLINTSQQIGGALGLAVLATIANSRTDDVMASAGGNPAELPQALTEGFQAAFLTGAGFALLGAVMAVVLIRSSDSRAHVAIGNQGEQPAQAPA